MGSYGAPPRHRRTYTTDLDAPADRCRAFIFLERIVRRTFKELLFGASALCLVSVAAGAQRRPSLGPADGMNLPPLDTGRVSIGSVAPDFTLEAKDGGNVTLSQFRGKKDVVLVFYRGHW